MAGVQSLVDVLVRTFGPFLIPVTVFAVGVMAYTALFLVTRYLRGEAESSVGNVSAGTPEERAADDDPAVSSRDLVPDDLDSVEDGEETDDDEIDGRTDGERPHPDD